MSQGPLCPNLNRKVQKEVSQIANHNLSVVMLLGGLSVNLNHLKTKMLTNDPSQVDKPRAKVISVQSIIDTPKQIHLSKWQIININKSDLQIWLDYGVEAIMLNFASLEI